MLALALAAAAGPWLAGDLHVHTCYSHDVWCGPGDDNTGIEEAYTLGSPVGVRYREAAARGLDWLAVTDHNDVRSVSDPGRGAGGVVAVAGYEASLRGHAQVLGLGRVVDRGDSGVAAIRRLAGVVRAAGGVLQVNHPGNQIERDFTRCSDTSMLDWRYGFDVVPDTVEVLNLGSPVPPAERYLECWLDRGARVAVTGGSDSHWLTLALVGMGIGTPTTWVLSDARSERGVLAGLRAGHTAVSRASPATGGAPLLLEADGEGDGAFEAVQGHAVPPGAAMRVRSLGAAVGGVVSVRSASRELLSATLAPGGAVRFRAPSFSPSWVRAVLYAGAGANPGGPGCNASSSPISTCAYDRAIAALTSPLYVRAPAPRYSVAGRVSARLVRRRRGVRVRVRCASACRVRGVALIRGRRVGSGGAVLRAPGTAAFRVRLDRRALRSLRRGSRIGLRFSGGGAGTVRRTIRAR